MNETSTNALHVLLVEDNELDARSIRRDLENQDTPQPFALQHQPTLADGVAALEAKEFDCVLLDLSLPDSQGIAAVRLLLDRFPRAPIVVLTGLNDPQAAIEAVEAGAQDYLIKDSGGHEALPRAVRYAVARHRSETELRRAQHRIEVMSDRERIARDLHDNVIQELFAVGMGLQAMLSHISDPSITSRLTDSVGRIDAAIFSLRDAVFGITTPPPDITLTSEIERTAASVEDQLGFAPIVRVTGAVSEISETIRHDVLATVKEALSNIVKYADASVVEVVASIEASEFILHVSDNGVGLPETTDRSDERSGLGLNNIAERAASHGGVCHVGPGPGGGTRILWTVPLT